MTGSIDQLLLHKSTKKLVDNALTSPAHALLIVGAEGSGKVALAKMLAANILGVTPDNLQNFPFFLHVKRQKNKRDIGISQVRQIISNLKLKVPNKNAVSRVIFIEDAHHLSLPAQNALLKVLEEPAQGTVFLLSATSVQNVLPTIASRAQALKVQPIALADAKHYWTSKHSAEALEAAWSLSGGQVGLMQALLSDELKHPLKESVSYAREFLGAKTYKRLLLADKLAKDKEQLALFLDALTRILGYLQRSALKNHKQKQSSALLKSRKQLQNLKQALAANTNPKLVALNLVLNLDI